MCDLEAHCIAVTVRCEFTFECAHEIVDVFVIDVQIAVPGDPELIAAGDFHAAEKLVNEGVDHRG